MRTNSKGNLLKMQSTTSSLLFSRGVHIFAVLESERYTKLFKDALDDFVTDFDNHYDNELQNFEGDLSVFEGYSKIFQKYFPLLF